MAVEIHVTEKFPYKGSISRRRRSEVVRLVLAATPYGARQFCAKLKLDFDDVIIIQSVRTLEGLRFRYEDVLRAPGWSKRDDIEEIEDRILRTHISMGGLHQIQTNEKDGVDWDIDANLPTYTRDFLRMTKEGTLEYPLCTYGTETH